MKRISLSLTVASLSLLACCHPALADTVTSTFQVTANVLASCTISSTGLNFGNYSQAQVTATANLTVTCTKNQGYDVSLNKGLYGTSVTNRAMQGPSGSLLNYGLFRDNNHTSNWGETISSDTLHGNGSGSSQVLTIYGLLPANQQVDAGAYSDTVTATITY